MADNDQQLFDEIEAEAQKARQEELRTEETDSFKETWEEVRRANRLATKQATYQEAQGSNDISLFSGPSLFKYAIILLMFAIPNDLVDALDFTEIGIIISWLISTFLSITTLLIMWFADSELQRVKSHMANKGKYQQALAKTATKVATKLTKFAPRNPITKVVAGAILEMVPIISILPWSSISVFLAYLDEKKTFKEAREAVEESYIQLPETAVEMV